MEFNHRMHKIRKGVLMTQKRLSDETGLSQAVVSGIENGRIIPTELEAKKIAIALRVSVEEVF